MDVYNKDNNMVNKTEEKKQRDIRRYSQMSIENIFDKLNTSNQGLSNEEVERRQEKYGKNSIEVEDKYTDFKLFLESLINPFNLILIVVAVVTYFTDVILSPDKDYITVSIIILMVAISTAISFIQSRNSNRAAKSLKDLVANTCHVIRNGGIVEIDVDEVVPGDIVKLSAGDMLPADVRFIQTKDTFLSQSALTGESNPIEKFTNLRDKEEYSLVDLENIGLLGTDLVSGSATAVVVHTGQNTYFSTIAKSLESGRERTSFEKGVNEVSKLLIRMMLLIIPLIFVINAVVKKDWLSALLFSISIAVGLTPEMLPVIMTSTLATGAQAMSKKKVIVRDLGSIQTFGEMDVLCTDKTGTLTEDKIVLEKYIDLRGNDDTRVLRNAYLNSYFQTGLKNLIDLAVINRAEKNGLTEILNKYERIDEIPFDFNRRRMSVVLQDEKGTRRLVTKGAVEEVMEICSYVEIDGEVLPLGETEEKIAMETYLKHNHDGLRIIAVAQKHEVPDEKHFSVKDESEMILIGFIGFLDPPKESAAEAIQALKDHGVKTVVLTGDSEGVALKVCSEIGLNIDEHYTGTQVSNMTDQELADVVDRTQLFSKLDPMQKRRVIEAYKEKGHTVGYMGDGINDAPALRRADVGISVDSAVDIAKETADIILLEKDLMVLEEGVLEGRKTFGNVMKYLKMSVSGNFGNMVAVIVASIFLPFLPMLPVHILTQNLLNDFAQIGIAFDNVDPEYLRSPRKWNSKSIKLFTYIMGPISSIFDILIFASLWYIFGYKTLEFAPQFQAGWFVFGTVSQIVITYAIRTERIPFIRSKPAKGLVISTLLVSLVAISIAFIPQIAILVDLVSPNIKYLWVMLGIILLYSLVVEVVKKFFMNRFGEWL
ncbi:magnesium-translocating P-type ATPase [Helcococcus sueciensis]|uniref:magnesium-translocating P-type ATPase n=1 Tax=Helcococcus sueciensis TaxID=241555 RepID=UPI00040E0C7C|nr:magnesium-translocating P-type ATPase [Helcococcus sueciensis]